ncbi:MAG: hypothetical protein ABSF15_16195 [Candidatus Sulfotelmatobacter sp.]
MRLRAATALALAGDASKAQKLADELNHDFPLATNVQDSWVPTIRAVIKLGRGRATEAIELLQPSNSYERDYLPAYIRGQAHLVAHDGTAAAAEFKKLLDHRGIVQN